MAASRSLIVTTLAALGACVESPAPGWKTLSPDQAVRGDCEPRGFVLRDRDGALPIISDPAQVLGSELGASSVVPHGDGWLASRISCRGELCYGDYRNSILRPDGSEERLELAYNAAAVTAEGLYLLGAHWQYGGMWFIQTFLYRASDLHDQPVQVGDPWFGLWARAVAVDEQGTIWLLGGVYRFDVELEEVLLRVEDGRPQVVHHIREANLDRTGMLAYYTQLVSVGDGFYIADPLRTRPLLRLTPSGPGFIEQQVVPSACRTARTRTTRTEADDLSYEATERLRSLGIHVDRGVLSLLDFHADLDTIVDHLIELVPADGTYTLNVLTSGDGELSLAALERLPPGILRSLEP